MNTPVTIVPLMTADETASLIGVKPTTLKVWRSTKRYPLPFVKVGRSVRYRSSDVEKFLRERTVEPAAV
jgi:excisionase family DNA binding protein